MSRSSPSSEPSDRDSRRVPDDESQLSSGSRGDEHRADQRGEFPLVGLVTAVAVVTGLGLYATVVADIGVPGSDRQAEIATTTLDTVHDAVTRGGVAAPARLATAVSDETTPTGYTVRVQLSASGRTWRVGPTPPADVQSATASRTVGVELGPGRVRPGELTVEVWQ